MPCWNSCIHESVVSSESSHKNRNRIWMVVLRDFQKQMGTDIFYNYCKMWGPTLWGNCTFTEVQVWSNGPESTSDQWRHTESTISPCVCTEPQIRSLWKRSNALYPWVIIQMQMTDWLFACGAMDAEHTHTHATQTHTHFWCRKPASQCIYPLDCLRKDQEACFKLGDWKVRGGARVITLLYLLSYDWYSYFCSVA